MKKFLSVLIILAMLTTLLLTTQVSVMADDFTSGLVAHYDFNKISDGVIQDVSGNGHNGTYQNVSAATGNVDGAVQIAGSLNGAWYDNTDVPRVALPSAAFTSEDITIAILFNADFSETNGNNCVVMTSGATWDTQFTFVNFWLNHDNNGGIGPHMAIQPSEGERSHLRTEDDWVEEAEWTWLVYTQTNGTGTFYLNGNEVASGEMYTTIGEVIEQGAGDLCIGASAIFPGDAGFAGLVDEVLVYNRAITASEAKNINNAVQKPVETEAPSPTAPAATTTDSATPEATEQPTEAPETTTPATETAAPETTAPATTVPATKAPATTAPAATDDATQGDDNGGNILPVIIVIVVVVIVAAAGLCYYFLVVKKKK